MLYDTKLEVEVKADPLSLESLIAWLEKQNPNEVYAWHCQSECMVGQWLKTIDRGSCEDPDGDSFSYIVNGEVRALNRFQDIALFGEATFGAALSRARADLP